jgi:hypothetical protein
VYARVLKLSSNEEMPGLMHCPASGASPTRAWTRLRVPGAEVRGAVPATHARNATAAPARLKHLVTENGNVFAALVGSTNGLAPVRRNVKQFRLQSISHRYSSAIKLSMNKTVSVLGLCIHK